MNSTSLPPLPGAAALQDLDVETRRASSISKIPTRPIVVADPKAKRVLVRQRLVAQHHAMDVGRLGGQRDVPSAACVSGMKSGFGRII